MENFKVYSTYDLKGNALEQLTHIHAQTLKNVEALEKLQGVFSILQGKISRLSTALNKLNKLDKVSSDFKLFSHSIENSTLQTEKLSKNVFDLSQGFKSLSAQSLLANKHLKDFGAIKVARHSLGGIGRGSGMAGEVMLGAGHGMGGTGGAMLGMSGTGLVTTAAAYGLYKAGKSGYNSFTEYQKIQTQLKSSGLSWPQVKEAEDYTSNLNIPGVSKLQAFAAFNDSWMATRKFQDAKSLTPTLSKAMLAAHISFKGLTDEQEKNLIRFSELRSGGDLKKMNESLNLGFKMMNLSAGSLKPTELRTFMRMASGPASHMSDLGLISLEPIIQEMGGNLTGTAIQSMTKQLGSSSGSMTGKESIKDLVKLGIYDRVKYGRNGKIISTHTKDSWYNLFQDDPYAFFSQLSALYEKNGTMTPDEKDRRLGLDFPNNRGARFFRTIHKSQHKISNVREEAPTLSDTDKSLQDSSGTQMASAAYLGQAASDLSKNFGEIMSPGVITGMNALNQFLNGLNITLTVLSKIPLPTDLIMKGVHSIGNALNPQSGLNAQDKKMAEKILGGNLSKQLIYGKPPQPTQQVTVINLDGRKIAEAVTKEQARGMSAGGTFGSQMGINPLLDPSPAGIFHFGNSF